MDQDLIRESKFKKLKGKTRRSLKASKRKVVINWKTEKVILRWETIS